MPYGSREKHVRGLELVELRLEKEGGRGRYQRRIAASRDLIVRRTIVSAARLELNLILATLC